MQEFSVSEIIFEQENKEFYCTEGWILKKGISYDLKTGLKVSQGNYKVSVLVWANGGLGETVLEANGHAVNLSSRGAVQIDGTKTWDRVVLSNVVVDETEALEVSVKVSDICAEEGYFKTICLEKVEETAETQEISGLLIDTFKLVLDKDEVRDDYLDLLDLEAGYYTVAAKVQNTGDQKIAYIYAGEAGSENVRMTAVPRSDFPYDGEDAWKWVFVRGVVCQGSLRIGLYSDLAEGQKLSVDCWHLVKDDAPYELLNGGDITELTYVEDMGGKFYDMAGEQIDPLEYLSSCGWNVVRIRIYNNPGKGRGNGIYYIPEGYQDVDDALRLAKRAKAANLKIQLSFHYSDFWSNPGVQIIPYDWQKAIENCSFEESVEKLEELIYSFTAETLQKLRAQDTMPEHITVGNETRSGLLYDFGNSDPDIAARFYNAGAKAIRDYAPEAKVGIHIDDGGNLDTYYKVFDEMEKRNVDYDVIGSSFYPFWTQKTPQEFVEFCNVISKRYQKPIMCMETAIGWTPDMGRGIAGQLAHNGCYGDKSTSTPELQKDYMVEFTNSMKSIEGGMGIGILYWDPIMIYADGKTGWAIKEEDDVTEANVVDNTTLFDFSGKALPVVDAYRYNS